MIAGMSELEWVQLAIDDAKVNYDAWVTHNEKEFFRQQWVQALESAIRRNRAHNTKIIWLNRLGKLHRNYQNSIPEGNQKVIDTLWEDFIKEAKHSLSSIG